jgi:hypothetical protein
MLFASRVSIGGFTSGVATGTVTSTVGTVTWTSPITVTEGATVTLLLTGVVGTTGSDGVEGVEEPPPPPPEPPPPLTGALAVRAVAVPDASDVPIKLVATTVNVYVVSSARPVIVQLVVRVVHVAPPFAVAV